jgi:hypothetical protein
VNLLGKSNPKLLKGEQHKWITYGLSLAPHIESGDPETLCPYSTAACRNECLFYAGRGQMGSVKEARRVKAKAWMREPELFLRMLTKDLNTLQRRASRDPYHQFAVRLNVFSDVRWEDWLDLENWDRLQFYDYTKYPLHKRYVPDNYHLTYSMRTKSKAEWKRAESYLDSGHTVAVVVHPGSTFRPIHPTVDGDVHDLRFLDPPGHWVVLKPKGRAIGGKFGV